MFTVETLQDPDVAGPTPAPGPTSPSTAIDAKTVQFKLATPIGGFLAAATQPLAPAHLLADVPFADLARATSFGERRSARAASRSPSSTSLTVLVLRPARRRRADGTPVVAAPRADRHATRSPRRTRPHRPVCPDPYLDADRVPLLSTRRRRWPPPSRRATSTRCPGCRPSGRRRSPTEAGSRAAALPDDDADRGPAQPAAEPSGAARRPRSAPALLGAIDRDALIAEALGGRRASAADALVPPIVVGVRRQAVAGRRRSTRRRPPKALTRGRLEEERRAVDRAASKAPLTLELLSPGRGSEPAPLAAAADVAKRWTAFGICVDVIEACRRPTSSRAPARRRVHGGGRATSRWASSPTCTRCSRRARRVTGGSNLIGLPGPGARHAAGGRPRSPARPRRADGRLKALPGRARRPPIPSLPLAWHRRGRRAPRGSTDPRRGSSRTPGTGSGMC